MVPIPVRCRCGKQPCEYELPSDWVVTALDLQSPALQPLIQPVNAANAASAVASLPWHFAQGRDREIIMNYMRHTVTEIPEPGMRGTVSAYASACACACASATVSAFPVPLPLPVCLCLCLRLRLHRLIIALAVQLGCILYASA
jgi:hypothetical protein